MEIAVYITIGLVIGAVIGWLVAKSKTNAAIQFAKDAAQQSLSAMEVEFASYKATTAAELKNEKDNIVAKNEEIRELNKSIVKNQEEIKALNNQLATATANHQAAIDTSISKAQEIEKLKKSWQSLEKKEILIIVCWQLHKLIIIR